MIFQPTYTPRQMLEMGVFGGDYFNDEEWREGISEELFEGLPEEKYNLKKPDKTVNYYGVLAGKDQGWWEERGMMHPDDPRGWFQWYCKYYYGRRHEDDSRQIKRWENFIRRQTNMFHSTLRRNKISSKTPLRVVLDDVNIYPKYRQSILQWAWNPVESLEDYNL